MTAVEDDDPPTEAEERASIADSLLVPCELCSAAAGCTCQPPIFDCACGTCAALQRSIQRRQSFGCQGGVRTAAAQICRGLRREQQPLPAVDELQQSAAALAAQREAEMSERIERGLRRGRRGHNTKGSGT